MHDYARHQRLGNWTLVPDAPTEIIADRRVNMGNEFAAAYNESKRRFRIGAADHVHLRAFRSEEPALLSDIGESFGLVGMNVREKDCVELRGLDSDLR
jgi:hypothetical protein